MQSKTTGVMLEYEGQLVELPDGESFAGRGTECRVRFNDPSVSRVHLRLTVQDGVARAEDLESTNGTWVNNEPLHKGRELADGDVVHIGRRRFRMNINSAGGWGAEEDTYRWEDAADGETPLPIAAEPSSESPSIFSRPNNLTPAGDLIAIQTPSEVSDFADLLTVRLRSCPRCRFTADSELSACPKCGFSWLTVRPQSPTVPVDLSAEDRRADVRWRVWLPVAYSSEGLTFRGWLRDLSWRGTYLVSDLLDPEGTICQLSVLPDAEPHMAFGGIVRHVVSRAMGQGGRPPGMGIKFTAKSEAADHWLTEQLTALEAAGSVREVVE